MKSKHASTPPIRGWNPPPLEAHIPAQETPSVVSATECTGLEAQPVIDHPAAEHYTELYGVHAQKPQGNIGKGNPRNDPSERAFHRT